MTSLVVPSEIPRRRLKEKDLEECLFWLLDDMGAKDLEWRVGGTGGGAADQGRDLEASFYMATPDGDIVPQRWWIEAKGRSRTVEPAAVRDAVTGTAAQSEVDVVVIATNAGFSNPTRDWVKSWNKTHHRPRAKLWDRYELERLISRHPSVAVRLFANALTISGRADVVRSQFWDRCFYATERDLALIWDSHESIDLSADLVTALSASEFANGNINQRPWSKLLDRESLVEQMVFCLINTISFVLRAERAGAKQEPYLRAVAYSVLVALDSLPAGQTADLVRRAWDFSDAQSWPDEIRSLVLKPVIGLLKDEIRDVCVSDCSRVLFDPVVLTGDQIARYWQRLSVLEATPEPANPKDLVIELHGAPCKVGFALDHEVGCPLLGMTVWEEEPMELDKAFEHLKQVIEFRKQAAE
jgi:hypothetical protein